MTEGNEVLEEQIMVLKGYGLWSGTVSEGLERFRRERWQWWEIFSFKLSKMLLLINFCLNIILSLNLF